MINKYGKVTGKLGIILNVLLHYGKYEKLLGSRVKIVRNNGKEKYNDYIGKTGIVSGFEYRNFSNPLIITFFTNKTSKCLCFSFNEIEKVD